MSCLHQSLSLSLVRMHLYLSCILTSLFMFSGFSFQLPYCFSSLFTCGSLTFTISRLFALDLDLVIFLLIYFVFYPLALDRREVRWHPFCGFCSPVCCSTDDTSFKIFIVPFIFTYSIFPFILIVCMHKFRLFTTSLVFALLSISLFIFLANPEGG
jgi:hypothetical protein